MLSYLCVGKLLMHSPSPTTLPCKLFPKTIVQKFPWMCMLGIYMSPGNRIKADIFSNHLLASCAFVPHEKCPFVCLAKKQVCLCSLLCVTSLIPLVNWDEHRLCACVRRTSTTNRLTFCTDTSDCTSLLAFCLEPSLQKYCENSKIKKPWKNKEWSKISYR